LPKTHFIEADAREIPLADGSVQCCVTSPPYWGLRDYGHDGQIGLEPTLAEYLRTMVAVFGEVRRVLRDDGCLWLNMGDGFHNGDKGGHPRSTTGKQATSRGTVKGLTPNRLPQEGFKPKDLLMQPHRLAIALQEDGWYVRMDNVWHKPNPMPESVTDRPTKSHEYVFLLTKAERYYYDAHAVREPAQDWGTRERKNFRGGTTDPLLKHSGFKNGNAAATGRNLRSVWRMTTRSCKEAHFATFPIDLPRRCIQAGTSERGCCPTCRAPWRRIVDKVRVPTRPGTDSKVYEPDPAKKQDALGKRQYTGFNARWKDSQEVGNRDPQRHCTSTTTTAWVPGCKCPPHEPVPCRVLDIFGGAATTALAAHDLGRDCVIVERKREYLDIGRKRLAEHKPRKVKVRRKPEPKGEPLLWGAA
jgi:DNA modification methylase